MVLGSFVMSVGCLTQRLGGANDTEDIDVVDTSSPVTVGDLVVATTCGEEMFAGMALSVHRATENGDRGAYLTSGWSGEVMEVEAGSLQVWLGNPDDTVERTADGYPISRYEGEGYVASSLPLLVVANEETTARFPVNLLVGEKEYSRIKVDCYNLKQSGVDATVYYSGESWKDGWTIYHPWVYQTEGTVLVADDIYEENKNPFGFLGSDEWLEVSGTTIVLKPDDSPNIVQDARVSSDDFAFNYLDLGKQYWCGVTAKAW